MSPQTIPTRKNWLLIAGTQQKVGKTTLSCRIIRAHSVANQIVGIKVCPHFHQLAENEEIVAKTENYTICRENKPKRNKDSSKFLKAGARLVFYVQTTDEFLPEVIEIIDNYLQPNDLIVCESGGLRKYIKPAVFILCNRKDNPIIKESAQRWFEIADICTQFDDNQYDYDFNRLKVIDNEWVVAK